MMLQTLTVAELLELGVLGCPEQHQGVSAAVTELMLENADPVGERAALVSDAPLHPARAQD